MAYLKPPMFVQRVFNPLAMRFGIGGATTLAVAGRRSGKAQKVPVIPVNHGGARYLVSTRGEAEWVRNLRAVGTGELTSRGRIQRFRATEVPVAERGPIIAAYRKVAGRTVTSYFSTLPNPADHPVFRIEPGAR
ncbi:MAG: nitroreductase family deazaflavin-dependent oxidoreductase [Dehalococcoidia bacterium]